MRKNRRNLAKYAAHKCCIFFRIFPAYANSSDKESKLWSLMAFSAHFDIFYFNLFNV